MSKTVVYGDVAMEKTAFLLSNWYSGATLATMLLDQHPDIVSNGEAFPFRKQFPLPVCSCGAPLTRCEFYRFAAAHMRNGGDYDPVLFTRDPNSRLPPLVERLANSARLAGPLRDRILTLSRRYRGGIDEFFEAHRVFMERALLYSGSKIYIDATKSLARTDLLLKKAATSSSIVWLLVRDCRGFCLSTLRNRSWPVLRVPRAARAWLAYIRRASRLAGKHPAVRFRILRYEDLCRSPLPFLNHLYSQLGLSRRDEVWSADHTPHILGNRMRLTFDGKVQLREEWRTQLDDTTQGRIIRIAGREMERLGYL